VLHFLSRFDPEARLLVLGTARSEKLDPRPPLPTLLRHLRSASQLAEIVLEPLDAAETAELAAQVGNRVFDADAATRLYQETRAIPLRRGDGAAESAGDPPPGVRRRDSPAFRPRARGDRRPPGPALGHARETAAARP